MHSISVNLFNLFSFLLIILPNIEISAKLLNESEYLLLPKLIELDPYDQCRLKAPSYRYCVAEMWFRPISNTSNRVWELIEEMNEDRRNFQHNFVRRGRCLERNNGTDKLETSEYFKDIFNEEFNGDGFVVYDIFNVVCDYFDEQMDNYDIMAIIIVLSIAVFIFVCTFADLIIFRKQENLSRGSKYIQCFSLINNWKRFQSVKESKDSLKFIQGLRFLTMGLLIFGHNIFLLIYSPAYNSYIFEEQYRRISSAIIFNGLVMVQVYFFLSGMFLGYTFFKIMFNYKFKFRYLVWGTLGRYNRLTPSLAIVTMINATFIYHVGSGALWTRNILEDRDNCRQYWWANLLYVTNEIKPDKMCMLTGWYIAADFQLFLFSLCLFTLIWFKREWVGYILGTTFVISLLIPGVLTYIYQLDAIPLVYPEILKFFFAGYDTFQIVYIQPHTNASTYIFGIIIGYFLYAGHLAKKPPTHFLFIGFLYTLAWISPLAVLFGAYYFYTDYYEYNRLYAAIFSSLYKLIFVITIAILMWASQTGYAKLYIRFLEWKPFVILGRLSFSMYLVHWPIIRVATSMDVIPTYYNYFNVIALKFPSFLILTILFGLILALFIEFPISGLMNLLTESVDELKSVNNSPQTESSENVDQNLSPKSTDMTFVNRNAGKENDIFRVNRCSQQQNNRL